MSMQMKEEFTQDEKSWHAAIAAMRERAEEDWQELLEQLHQVQKELEVHQQRRRWELDLRAELEECNAKMQASV